MQEAHARSVVDGRRRGTVPPRRRTHRVVCSLVFACCPFEQKNIHYGESESVASRLRLCLIGSLSASQSLTHTSCLDFASLSLAACCVRFTGRGGQASGAQGHAAPRVRPGVRAHLGVGGGRVPGARKLPGDIQSATHNSTTTTSEHHCSLSKPLLISFLSSLLFCSLVLRCVLQTTTCWICWLRAKKVWI